MPRNIALIVLILLMISVKPFKRIFAKKKNPQLRLPSGAVLDLRSSAGQEKLEQMLREDAIKNHRPSPEMLKSLGKNPQNAR